MPQSDGKNRLKRIEFVIGGTSYAFQINPDEYTQDEPSRSTVTQTKGGAWVDDFGAGLPVIGIRGTTGFQNGQGVQKFKELRDLIRKYYNSAADTEFVFHNWTDDESWVVHTDPQGFRLMRSKSNPLLYMYDIRLVCLRPATQPKMAKTAGGVGETLGSALPMAPLNPNNWREAAEKYVNKQLNMLPKLPPVHAIQAVQPLKVAADGKVQNVSSYTAEHQAEFSFTPYLSPLAVEALQQYKTYPKNYRLSPVPGTILEQLKAIEDRHTQPELETAFRMVLLELLALWEAEEKDLPKKMSVVDLDRAIENAHWVAEQLFQKADYQAANQMRWIARVFQYIRNSETYQSSYAQKVGELINALR